MPLTAINAAIDALVKVPNLSSVTATGAKLLTVTFNGPVDSTKAVFAVKKGLSTVSVAETTWNADKSAAVLEVNTKLTEGTYNVSVTGLSTAALTGSVVVENEKVAEIKILSDSLLTTDPATALATGEATVGYQALNQYGEDITDSALANAFDYIVTPGAAASDNDGTITVTTPAGTETGDKFVMTIIDPATAITVNKTLTVIDEATVSSVTLGDVYNEDGKTLSEDTMVGNEFYLLIDVKDQYGSAVTDAAKAIAGLTVLTSKSAYVDIEAIDTVTIDEVDHLAIPLDPQAAGSSVITAVVKANGTTASKTVTVEEGTKIDTVVIGTPDGTITGATEINIPVTVTDNKGVVVTDVADIDAVDNPIVATQGAATPAAAFVEEDGQIYIQLTTASTATTQNLIVTVTTATSNVTSKVFQVKADPIPTTLVGLDSTVSKSIIQGQALDIDAEDFIVEDQYGNVLDPDVTTYSISGTTATPANGFTVVDNGTGVTVAANATATNNTITFSLDQKPASTITAKFTAIKATDFVSYKVDNFGTLFVEDADSLYAKELKVYGVTSGGAEVLLPVNSGFYNVTTTANLLNYTVATGMLNGINTGGLLDADEPSKAATATVTINATGAVLTSTGTVTITDPEIVKVEAVEEASDDPATLQTETLKALTSATVAGGAQFNLDSLLAVGDFVTTDTYGVREKVAKVDVSGLTLTKTSGTVSFANNGTPTAAVIANTANAVVDAKLAVDGVAANNVAITLTSVFKTPSTIVFAAPGPVAKTVGDAVYTNAVTGVGNGPITYVSSNTAVATVNATTGAVTFVAPGATTITATKAATDAYTAVTNSYVINVAKAASVFTFASEGPIAKTYGDAAFTNAITNGAGTGAITFTSGTPGVATVDANGLVTIVSAGSTVITATKAADATHDAVTHTYTVNVAKAASVFTFASEGPIAKTFGDAAFTNAITNGAGAGSITFTSGTPGVATVDASTGEVTLVTGGTTVITATKAATATHETVSHTYTVNVAKAASVFTFADAGPIDKLTTDADFTNAITNGAGAGAITFTSGTPGVATVNANTGEVAIVGGDKVGSTVITATKAATATHEAVVHTYTVNVVSEITDIKVKTGFGTIVTAIDNGATTLTVATATTVEALLAAIESTDGTTQTYEVTGKTTGALVDDDELVVTAQDGTTVATYVITVS